MCLKYKYLPEIIILTPQQENNTKLYKFIDIKLFMHSHLKFTISILGVLDI